jgi:hypothetical protein
VSVAATDPLVAVAKGLAGFVLGGLMSVFVPPLAFAIALVLGGVMLWSRLRGEDVQPLTWFTTGYLAAVAAYVVLVLASALG